MATKSAKIPPHSDEAEESVLGSILIDKDAISVIAPLLKPDHFYNENNGRIYEAALILYENRRPIDLVTLTSELKKTKDFTRIGGASYLADLTNRVATAVNVEEYAQIIKRSWIKRRLISSSSRISALAFDETKESSQVLEEAEKEIFAISQSGLTRSFIPVKDALIESFDRLDELHKRSGGLRGLPTGFTQLDNLLAGMQNSNLIILAARPGIGKTALSLNIARHVAVEEKIPVGIFSLEMSQEELVDRLLVRQAQIDSWKLKTGRLDEDDFSRLSDAMGTLAEAPLYIDDTPGISILEMRTKARRLQMEKGLKLLIVDYLQLIHGRNIENRVQEVSEISQGLKNLARELKIPVLSLSQLSRAVEVRGGQRPRLADLRESGSIEQDSDVVMFLFREDDDDRESVVLELAKHRNGPIGAMNLRFVQKQISFYPLEKNA
jgi:replicative DNA helicase